MRVPQSKQPPRARPRRDGRARPAVCDRPKIGKEAIRLARRREKQVGTHGQVCGLFPHVFRHHQHSERVRILTRLHSCSLGGKTALLDWQAAIAVTSRYARDAASGPLDKKTHFSHLNAPSLRVHQSRGLPARRAGIHFPPGQWRLPGGCSTEKPRGFPIPPTRALLRGRAAPRCSHRGVSRRWTGRWDRHTDREGCQACFREHFPSPRGVDPRATVRHTWRDLASRRGTDLKSGRRRRRSSRAHAPDRDRLDRSPRSETKSAPCASREPI